MNIAQLVLSLTLYQDAKKSVEIHPSVAPIILRIEAEKERPDFQLENLVPENYREGGETKVRWVAELSSYHYQCAREMKFGDVAVTYCLASDELGVPILAVRMKFPARLADQGSIPSIVQSSDIDMISYNRGPFRKGVDLVDKRDNVKMKMKGAYGAPDMDYITGFADGKPAQSWYIHTCQKFTDSRNQQHHDNPSFFERWIINGFWKSQAGFYRAIFPVGDSSNTAPETKLVEALSQVEKAARGRMERRLGDDAKNGLYKVEINRQSEVCEAVSSR